MSFSAEVFFTPSTHCEDHIISEITNATKSIDIAVYSINNDKVVNAIIAAHKKGTKIRILTDHTQASVKGSKILELVTAGLDLKLNSKNKIMHNKFAIFDEKDAINGSFNWTNPASSQNAENCVLFTDKEANVVSAYHAEFEKLWNINTADKSKKKLAKILAKHKQL